MRGTWKKSGVTTGMLLLLSAAAAAQPLTQLAPAEKAAALRIVWQSADHPSGVYYPKSTATLSLAVVNESGERQVLRGSIAFGPRTEKEAAFKALSLTPIAQTTLAPGEQAALKISATFEAAGSYELRWIRDGESERVENPFGITLQCIFAPRTAQAEPRWLTFLPRAAAFVPGYLPDLVAQTSVSRYLLDERFAFDVSQNVGLAAGAALEASPQQVDALFADLLKAKASLVLRVRVPLDADAFDARMVTAFHQYVEDAARRARGSLHAIIMEPEISHPGPLSVEERGWFRRYYLAGYEAAKGQDKRILLLGAGTAEETRDLLGGEGTENLLAYVDAVAATDAVVQPAIVSEMRKPLWVVPPRVPNPWPLVPTAASLGADADVVPVPPPEIDRGVTEHLLGGAAVYSKLPAGSLPCMVSFQGDHYAVVAIAGIGAGTALDGLYPSFPHGGVAVGPVSDDGKPGYPNLEVGDDTDSMRVVDTAGAPVNCRRGDTLYIPAGDHFVYVLAGESAEDLMSVLRVGTPNRLPVFTLALSSDKTIGGSPLLSARLFNISTEETGGKLRLLAPGAGEKGGGVLAEKEFAAVAPGKSLEFEVETAAALPADGTMIAELTTPGNYRHVGIVERLVVHVDSVGGK